MIDKKFAKLINRQRINPRVYDYSYLLLRNNIVTFRKFKEIILKGEKPVVLDTGCGFKPFIALFNQDLGNYIGIDNTKNSTSANVVASNDNLPFHADTFDGLIYSEVLEHTSNLKEAILEIRRIAKDNALIFISTPFVFPEHGIPYDFQRLTKYFYLNIFKNDELVILSSSNSSLSTVIVSPNLFIESTFLRRLVLLKNIFYTFFNFLGLISDFMLNLVFFFWGKHIKDRFWSMPLGYALVVKIKK